MLGSYVVLVLLRAAVAAGHRRFAAEVLGSNARMLGLLRDLGAAEPLTLRGRRGAGRVRAARRRRLRRHDAPMQRVTKLFEKILVPYDFSPSAEAALRVAASLAARTRGTLAVIHVMTPIHPIHGGPLRPPLKDVQSVARELARHVARTVRSRQIRAVRTRVAVGHPGASIVAAAGAADSIVMGKRGRSRLAHLLLGSVADGVVRIAPVPVLTVPMPRR